ncbi:flagellar assembly peptidoglycan hydrolase FlgJ [Plesiomonas sp. PI-19]|uniref:flagellar assembly peptidoglycan hydrolase FlgJ n=1 Tax=Plesiomonas sp. PI-19 TaxID=2898798 RepID=UPI001F39ED1A|nr:flagellar assembly peptidoglycan hydrolase FlgJ [Plesiomonas sp. PI-19]MCE5164281.1 flagellar assembly peptidoglycan hydrolase FlgJ [Plesiomonas sp. PI-19]
MDSGFVDASTYHDLNSLSRMREAALKNDKDALRAAANQFEATFMRQMLKSMRDANSAFKSEDSPFNSPSADFYQQMYDEELAAELSRKGSLGLADLLVTQLGGKDAKGEGNSAAPVAQAGGDLLSELRLRKNKSSGLHQPDPVAGIASHRKTRSVGTDDNLPDAPEDGFSSAQEFVATLFPHALKAAKKLGTTPAILIAQAALETGWGKSIIQNAAGSSNNLFNIKAGKSWDGDKVTVRTLEYFDGTAVNVTSPFRAYDSFADSFEDYVRFLQENGRYAQALKQAANPENYISHLQKAGYATDPRYANKVISILRRVQSLLE